MSYFLHPRLLRLFVLNQSSSISFLVWGIWCRRIFTRSSLPQEQTFRWDCLPQWPIKHRFHYYLCVGIWMWSLPFSFCFIHKHISKCQSKSLCRLFWFGVKVMVTDSVSNFWSCTSKSTLLFLFSQNNNFWKQCF